MDQAERSTANLKTHIHEALQTWHDKDSSVAALEGMRLVKNIRLSEKCSSKTAVNGAVERALVRLEQVNDEYGSLLRRRFQDCQTPLQVSSELSIAQPTFFTWQRRAIDRLTEIVANLEEEAHRAHISLLERRLQPPTYTTLVGAEHNLSELETLVNRADAPWLISLTGLGGIGKTSLAHALTLRTVRSGPWEDVSWFTAKRNVLETDGRLRFLEEATLTVEDVIEQLSEQLLYDVPKPAHFSSENAIDMLAGRLTERAHLIVLDNLETMQDLSLLVPLLRRMINPTKFVLTSRERLLAESDIFHYHVPELSQTHALNLVRQEAGLRNLPELVAADDREIKPVYDYVGGNPLALRLIVGQLQIYGLDDVLHHLREAEGRTVENLYTYLYRDLWDCLNEIQRRLLLAMLLVREEGDGLEILEATSQIERAELLHSLEELVRLNLIDSRGSLKQKVYSVHSLTRTFLHKQVLKWQ